MSGSSFREEWYACLRVSARYTKIRMRCNLTGMWCSKSLNCAWLWLSTGAADAGCQACQGSRAVKVTQLISNSEPCSWGWRREVGPVSCLHPVASVLTTSMEENGSLTSVKTVVPTPETLASAPRFIYPRPLPSEHFTRLQSSSSVCASSH